ALAPHAPSSIMRDIAERARQRAARTARFKAWANGNPRTPEHVCALGTKIDGIFTMDLAENLTDACRPGDAPLDFAMAMHVEPGTDGRRYNAFTLQLTTDTLSAARLRTLIATQTRLLHNGYPD